MTRIRLSSVLLNGLIVLLAGTAWLYLAPARVGGSTTYVETHGVSMEPRFHSGDLAIVRPASQYQVGDIVAYHSALLHLVVLHRIVATHDGRYTFKGDNNNFLDPVHPTRADLIGKLWVHVPRGGVVLDGLHSPVVDAAACGLLGLLLLWGVSGKRRRRKRRRNGTSGSGRHGPPLMTTPREHDSSRSVNLGALLTASAVASAVFVVLAAIVFTRPADKAASVRTRYIQQAKFGYGAQVPPDPVYPNGRIKTDDPIFPSIVRRLNVRVSYRFTSAAVSSLAGTEEILLKVAGPSGWRRSFVLAPSTHFAGDHTSTVVALDLRQLQSLMAQVERLTGNPAFGAFSFTVEAAVRLNGTLGGHPITTRYAPGLSFAYQSGQLQPISAVPSSGTAPGVGSTNAASTNYTPSQAGSIGSPATVSATLTVLGISPTVSLLRWISLVGLLLSAAATLLCYLRKRGQPFEESVRIQSQYGHMIVPIVAGEDLGWPAVDVATIKALVKLAESGQRLILHSLSNGVDTYMVNDEGTVYRYQVRPSKVVWGEWADAAVPVDEAAAA